MHFPNGGKWKINWTPHTSIPATNTNKYLLEKKNLLWYPVKLLHLGRFALLKIVIAPHATINVARKNRRSKAKSVVLF